MEILIPLLIALIILGIAIILDRRKKSRKQDDAPETPAKSGRSLPTPSRVEPSTSEKTVQQDSSVGDVRPTVELHSISEPETPYHTTRLPETPTKISEPLNYPDSWEKTSWHYREQKEWQCERCKLSLHQHKYYLHTHHVYGTRYDNLMALCIGCHSEQLGINHLLLKETPDYQGFIERYGKKWRMSNISDFESIRNKFRKYVEHESNILHYISSRDAFIKYESGCSKENGSRVVWLNAWLPNDSHKISASISIDRNSRFFEAYYQKLEAYKSDIKATFSFETITSIKVSSNIYQLRVEKENIDLTQIANLDTNFHWLRENLERLYWVLRVRGTLGLE